MTNPSPLFRDLQTENAYTGVTPNHFRIVVWLNSKPYQFKEEVNSIDLARLLRNNARSYAQAVEPQIIDDHGNEVT